MQRAINRVSLGLLRMPLFNRINKGEGFHRLVNIIYSSCTVPPPPNSIPYFPAYFKTSTLLIRDCSISLLLDGNSSHSFIFISYFTESYIIHCYSPLFLRDFDRFTKVNNVLSNNLPKLMGFNNLVKSDL